MMKTLLDGIFALIITGTGTAGAALMGPNITSVHDLTQAQLAIIALTAISAAAKTMQSRLSDPNKPTP